MRLAGAILLAWLATTGVLSAAEGVDYSRDIKPLLERHCYRCHGALKQVAGLRLDHIRFIRQGGDRGAALAATSVDSILIHAVEGTGDIERMPLEAKPLAESEIARLRAWIDAGAHAPDEPLPADPRDHWSFRKPVRPPLPEVQSAAWAKHPIDRFLAAEHERRGLIAMPPAEKNLLLRRVYLDLIGLPPTPAELRAFVADPSAEAYEKVVDRLLASPRYGERWGRHWMDVWRYSDWDGYGQEVRESQPHIWRWRDWIVESLNDDKPYDRMIEEMLSADEIAPSDESARRATGFLVRNWYKFNRNVWLDSTVEHTAKAFLGVTMNCARCHDHMYDPIPQTAYYQFRAFFEPHQVRTDRVPGQSDTKADGLVRVFDADADRPTYLFERGNEAAPDKAHPLVAAVPAVLGGDALKIASIDLPAEAYYPGLRAFVQSESLAQALAAAESARQSMAAKSEAVVQARKKLAELAAAKAQPAAQAAAAGNGAPATVAAGEPAKEAPPAPDETQLKVALADAEQAADLAECEALAAAAELVAVRAKIAADKAKFAATPPADAEDLAREAARAERVAVAERARHAVQAAEQALAKAKAASGEAAAKNVELAEKKLTEAREARDKAQAALANTDAQYTHLSEIYPHTSTGRRAALARWIASEHNPLTARVAINHIWLRHFGAPLVASVFDFGRNGQPPTHPELLDWLAVELMEQGWRMKSVHRLIVTSAAYQMASTAQDSSNLARDPENRFLWHAIPRRMEAEVVRDSTLHVSGGLDETMGGPELDQNAGQKIARRSLYFRNSKEKKMTFLDMFDRANVTDCYRRSETIVPQQALAMVNSPLSLAEARRLAAALAGELNTQATPESQTAFVAAAFERVLCRPPSDEERQACLTFLTEQAGRFAEPAELAAFTSGEESTIKPAADPHARARENLVHVLFNHNDFLTVR
jgi:hypothetical protein